MKLPKPGTKVKVKAESQEYDGVMIDSETDSICLKLDSGYNVGIKLDTVESIKEFGSVKPLLSPTKISQDPKLPSIRIIHTGGTIASKVDYATGAVISRSSPEEILDSVPELAKIASLDAKVVFQMFSEDLEVAHWSILAKEVAVAIKNNVKGVIIGMGTDTLEYVASALSFALKNCPIPVVVVGSQRSSDRPSSDASMNLLCAAQFIVNSDFKGVAVCLHDNLDDNNCLIVQANHVKKMHTSRRDTFRPVNKRPLARINIDGKIEEISKYVNSEAEFELKEKFNDKVGLVKVHPGFKAGQLDWYEKNCEGLVIEGYAFGQLPINVVDEHTKYHAELLEKIKSIAKKMPVVIVSQRPYGVLHMTVYSTSRHLLDAGVIEGKLQSHVALAKLSHVLANSKDARVAMKEDICGETIERSEKDTFLI